MGFFFEKPPMKIISTGGVDGQPPVEIGSIYIISIGGAFFFPQTPSEAAPAPPPPPCRPRAAALILEVERRLGRPVGPRHCLARSPPRIPDIFEVERRRGRPVGPRRCLGRSPPRSRAVLPHRSPAVVPPRSPTVITPRSHAIIPPQSPAGTHLVRAPRRPSAPRRTSPSVPAATSAAVQVFYCQGLHLSLFFVVPFSHVPVRKFFLVQVIPEHTFRVRAQLIDDFY